MEQPKLGLRERTRQIVAKEITDAARILFVKHGYEATTIDEIASAVGMSQRSVFRYFPTKEDIVLRKFDFTAEEMLKALENRPADEPVWTSLRHMLGVYVDHADEVEKQLVAIPIQRIIFGTPQLLASYLQKMHSLQDATVQLLQLRAETKGKAYQASDPTLRALVAAAFGCLIAAQHVWLTADTPGGFAVIIDQAIAALSPSQR